ncbi:MAG: phosphoglycerate dehydrogenase [Rhodopseudomonas palustris]|nr:phosphoglycerate dehydrogenase [Rhodopseudomonas palustris]
MALYHLGERVSPYIARLEREGFEVVRNPVGRCLTEDELVETLPGVFATIAGVEPYTERVFRAAPDPRIVARYGVGPDAVDVAAATRHGVAVAMAFGTNHEAVADSTLTLMAAVVGNVVPHHMRVRRGEWRMDIHPGLWRATVGIVGLGRIGKARLGAAEASRMRILAYDAVPDVAFARENGIEFVPLETLLREADIVTPHAPHTPETEDLINRERLALMKPTAYLVNTARGGLVDETALCEALASERLAGAGLDVFNNEPPTGSPPLDLNNVVLSLALRGVEYDIRGSGGQPVHRFYSGVRPRHRARP